MFWLEVSGRRTSIRTRISHGAREYDDHLLSLMARQLYLTRKELNQVLDCPMSGEDYLRILIQRGIVRL